MKTLYFECGMGAAGDMITAALLEISCRADPGSSDRVDHNKMERFVSRFNGIGIPGVTMKAEKGEKKGVTGTHVRILVNGEEEHEPEAADHHHEHHHGDEHSDEHSHNHEHHHHHHEHRGMDEVKAVIEKLAVDEDVREDVLAVYGLIAEAESKVHGTDVSEIHFHEVGTMDAIADVTAVCMLIHEISPDEIVSSPVATGFGTVRCAHGILPVPAPATALLLTGIPAYAGDQKGELCTPTGAALIRHFVRKYSRMPVMVTEAVGYGLGTKDFETANCLRVFYGESF